jgi:hypothetical protein
MARPPRFERPDPALLRESVKQLEADERARLLAWLLLYYDDRGELFSPQIRRGRQRIALDGVEYWLVQLPKRRDGSRAVG